MARRPWTRSTRLGRPLHDLRISVTDRCNFRCTYCMPKEVFGRDYAFLPRDQVLSFEEIERAARAFVGARASRSCGSPAASRSSGATCRTSSPCWPRCARPTGEPLDLTLTTNGAALRALARPLADAGLRPGHGQPRLARRRGVRRDERHRLPGRPRARRDRRRARGRPDAGQGQHGRPARGQRGLGRADGALGARPRRDPALHRVHGRRPLQRLAARRGRAGAGPDRGGDRAVAGRAASTPAIAARSPAAGATSTGAASSGSSRR